MRLLSFRPNALNRSNYRLHSAHAQHFLNYHLIYVPQGLNLWILNALFQYCRTEFLDLTHLFSLYYCVTRVHCAIQYNCKYAFKPMWVLYYVELVSVYCKEYLCLHTVYSLQRLQGLYDKFFVNHLKIVFVFQI